METSGSLFWGEKSSNDILNDLNKLVVDIKIHDNQRYLDSFMIYPHKKPIVNEGSDILLEIGE